MRILTEDNPHLKLVSEEVVPEELDEALNIAKELILTMNEHGGLGISAPQVGINKRIFIIKEENDDMICINPKIVEYSEEISKVPEGCLSYPDLWLLVPRHEWIRVEYIDEHNYDIKRKFTGITAQCFQHELDHLNGVTFNTKVSEIHLKMQKKKRRDRHRKRIT